MHFKIWQWFIFSTILSIGVITNAFFLKKEFYPSVVYLSRSSPSLTILYAQVVAVVWFVFKCFQTIFFGPLRAIEVEHVFEKSWYAITETCLAFTVFRDDFNTAFVVSFVFLLFIKCFHWIAEDRVDIMERSPSLPNIFHVRMLSIMVVLTIVDAICVHFSLSAVLKRGPSVQLVFAFEYAVLYSVVFMVAAKYTLHSLDQRQRLGWDRKVVWLLYAELATSFIRLLLYTAFISLMLAMKIFALFAIRPTYMAVRSFTKALTDVIRSRIAIRNLNTLFLDATVEDLRAVSDTVCIICREDMLVVGSTPNSLEVLCKKLQCGHLFHAGCLRSWFQRQQTCPTCRSDVVNVRSNNRNANGQQQQRQQQQPAGQQLNQPTQTTGTTPASPFLPDSFAPAVPFGLFLPPALPILPAVPTASTATASVSELQAREAVLLTELENRVKSLESVRQCLDASVVQLRSCLELANNSRNTPLATGEELRKT